MLTKQSMTWLCWSEIQIPKTTEVNADGYWMKPSETKGKPENRTKKKNITENWEIQINPEECTVSIINFRSDFYFYFGCYQLLLPEIIQTNLEI